jgi:hypothetical protein
VIFTLRSRLVSLNAPTVRVLLAACHAMSGRVEEAREACARLMQQNPALRISGIKNRGPFRRAEDIERLTQAFRIAGMPE